MPTSVAVSGCLACKASSKTEEEEKEVFKSQKGKNAKMTVQTNPLNAWWLGNHKSGRQSPWLSSTLRDLDEKMKQILMLIEEDADSFAQRAEMYYKKRPELMSQIEILYRSHRSLAEHYDQLRLEGKLLNRTTSFSSNFSDKSWPMKQNDESTKSSGTSSVACESEDSDVDDPEQESEIQADDSLKQMREELEKLKMENEMLKMEALKKDDEKREVIRQMCLAMDVMREENVAMKNYIKQWKKWSMFDFNWFKKGVLNVFWRPNGVEEMKSVITD